MKKLFAFLLLLGMIFAVSAPAFAADTVTAKPTSSTVLVNGENVSFNAYNINGNNYFKLRDLAYVLNGTEKQFDIGWDGENNTISLTSGEPYTVVGGEMADAIAGDKTAAPTNSKIYLDGEGIAFTAYKIGDNNYFKLRDIGMALDFGVVWNGADNSILIDTSEGYSGETDAGIVPALQNQLISYLSELFDKAYGPYYNGLHYEMTNYEETVTDGEYTATFFWTMYHLGNGLDVPDDLGKEQAANWSLQATFKLTADGRLDISTAVILGDNSATGAPTYQVPIEDYFPSK